MEESPLTPALLRGLADRSYDRRKAAASEVTALIKSLLDSNTAYEEQVSFHSFSFVCLYKVNFELQTAVAPQEKIVRVISLLTKDFVHSRNSNHRKGTHSSPF